VEPEPPLFGQSQSRSEKKIKKKPLFQSLFSTFFKNFFLLFFNSSVVDPDPHGSVLKLPSGSGSVFEMRIWIQGIKYNKKVENNGCKIQGCGAGAASFLPEPEPPH
jgi:hypothetical protein